MGYSETLNYDLKKPIINNDWGNWGGRLNENFDELDRLIYLCSRKLIKESVSGLSDKRFFGEYYETLNGVTLSAAPTDLYIGSNKLLFEVTSVGSSEIDIAGTSMSQNTLNETTSDTEKIIFNSAGFYVSKKYWTKDITVASTPGCTCNVYLYKGFTLDKNYKMVKIILDGTCNNTTNNLDIDIKHFVIEGNEVTIDTVSSLSIDETFPSGSYFYWHKELSIQKDLILNSEEMVVLANTSVSGSWDLNLSLYLE
jgi:hypothetical protein